MTDTHNKLHAVENLKLFLYEISIQFVGVIEFQGVVEYKSNVVNESEGMFIGFAI